MSIKDEKLVENLRNLVKEYLEIVSDCVYFILFFK